MNHPQRPTKAFRSRERAVKEHLQTYTDQEKADAWQKTAEIIKDYSDEKVERWIAEMDNLLVFSGLFSAVVTTFVAQTYLLLQPDAPDQTAAILQQISLQLASFSVAQPFVNSTQPAFTSPTDAAPVVSSSTVTLNILWFMSLILSLSVALVAIMVKQWLSEYRSGLSGTSLDIARLRQYRLNNLETWRVAEIVGTLPVVLQLSLVLFFVGLLVLLRDLDPTVAKVATGLVAIIFIIMGGTILLPVIWSDCCYLSATAYFTATVVHNVLYTVKHMLDAVMNRIDEVSRANESQSGGVLKTLTTLRALYARYFDSETYRGFMIWHLRERDIVRSAAAELNADMIFNAYSYTTDLRYLSETAATNLVTLPSTMAIRCFRRLTTRIIMDFGVIRAGALRINANMQSASAQSYGFWIAAMYQAMYLPEAMSRPVKFLAATMDKNLWSDMKDAPQRSVFDAYSEALPSTTVLPWSVGRHVGTAIDLVLHRRRTHTGPEALTSNLDETLFGALALLIRCCTTSLASPDATGANGKEEEVVACAQAAVDRLTASLGLQRCWKANMLSFVASVLEDLHQSAHLSRLVTDDLLRAALGAAGHGRTDDPDNLASAQRLEDVAERIRDGRPAPSSRSGTGLTMSSGGDDQVFYIDPEYRVTESYFCGCIVTAQRLY